MVAGSGAAEGVSRVDGPELKPCFQSIYQIELRARFAAGAIIRRLAGARKHSRGTDFQSIEGDECTVVPTMPGDASIGTFLAQSVATATTGRRRTFHAFRAAMKSLARPGR